MMPDTIGKCTCPRPPEPANAAAIILAEEMAINITFP
jgi:hypothetical protein